MLLRNDELNVLRGDLERYKGNLKQLKELMYDWLLLAYADGKTDVEEQLGKQADADIEKIDRSINQLIDGKNVFSRLAEWLDDDAFEDLYLLCQNERRRVYNTACYDTALELGAEYKTWHCSMLPNSRDTHIYLDGITKKMNEKFYTFNGDSTLYPKDFGIASEDINCLCYLTFQ